MSERIRVAYLGPEGTYTHQAAAAKFKNRAAYIPYESIASTFNSVCQDEVEYACIPLENSLHGSVIETLDLLRTDSNISIIDECTIGIEHCLVGRRGVQLKDITRVLSHEQALGQCQEFLQEYLPDAIRVKTSSTASAARQLLQLDDSTPLHSAAICSRICVDLYDRLEVLQSSIQDGQINFTRFIIMSRILLPSDLEPDVSRRALLRCILPQTPSNPYLTLSQVVKALPNGIELARVDRRPSLSKEPFHDCTFLEIVCQEPLSPQTGDTQQNWRDRIRELERMVNEALSCADFPCCCVLGAW
ncbi:prephenate dehydratase [Ceratobasidium sp. AG-Ba]|nr:prephenate dehydratase [Ceratobasidium sp. AG-Ba]